MSVVKRNHLWALARDHFVMVCVITDMTDSPSANFRGNEAQFPPSNQAFPVINTVVSIIIVED